MEEIKRTMDEAGVTDPFLGYALPAANLRLDYPPTASNRNYAAYLKRCAALTNAVGAVRAAFGPDALAFAYGADEAPPPTVLAERAIFQACHAVGGKVCVSSYYYPYLLFSIDMLQLPSPPRLSTKGATAELLHAGNPDLILGWYADPHSGPENPDYTRRLYGWQPWRANYDASAQYILFRNNWNDFWIPDEPQMRGLMIVYPQNRGILDTLAWEGFREGLDDIRYATKLQQLALPLVTSKNTDARYAAKLALKLLADADGDDEDLTALRLEMIGHIEKLMKF